MRSSIVKSRRARMVALAIGAAIVGPLAMAAPSLAAAPGYPLAGANCQSSDGKISGRGSTLQTWLQYDLVGAFANDVCGSTPADNTYAPDGTDPQSPIQVAQAPSQANWMVGYNGYNDQNGSFTGSSNGKSAINCRSDAFSGTDIPYTLDDWTDIDGPAGTEATYDNKGCNQAGFVSPFEPATYGTTDPASGVVMSFPIGGSAVEVAANISATLCGDGTAPAALKLTATDIANLFGGMYNNWEQLDENTGINGADDVGENPTLANCNLAIVRVTRNDTSGTTQALLNYLNDAAPSATTCDPTNSIEGTWAEHQFDVSSQELAPSTTNGAGFNNLWPGEQPGTFGKVLDTYVQNLAQSAYATTYTVTNSACSMITQEGSSGGPNLLTALHNTAGGVGYADVSDVAHDASPDQDTGGNASNYDATLDVATQVLNSTGTYSAPTSGTGSNCTLSGLQFPGSSDSSLMGMDGEWALDDGGGTAGTDNTDDDISDSAQGSDYPICTLTWDFVWSGEDGNLDTTLTGAKVTLPSATLNVASTAALTAAGLTGPGPYSFQAKTSTGFQWLSYTGISGNTLTGVTGGTAGATISANSNIDVQYGAGGPEPELTADQRRTLYSFFTYVLSDAAQSTEAGAGYAPLGETAITDLRAAFQQEF